MGSLEKRFRRKCSERRPCGCIDWLAWKNNSGYGIIKSSKKPFKHLLAHRVAYELHYGPIPEGMDVMHSCDNRVCVNWEHLSIGTRKDNMSDMVKKGRQKRSRFSGTDVERMRELHGHGRTQAAIASEYGISRPCVSLLLSGKIGRLANSST